MAHYCAFIFCLIAKKFFLLFCIFEVNDGYIIMITKITPFRQNISFGINDINESKSLNPESFLYDSNNSIKKTLYKTSSYISSVYDEKNAQMWQNIGYINHSIPRGIDICKWAYENLIDSFAKFQDAKDFVENDSYSFSRYKGLKFKVVDENDDIESRIYYEKQPIPTNSQIELNTPVSYVVDGIINSKDELTAARRVYDFKNFAEIKRFHKLSNNSYDARQINLYYPSGLDIESLKFTKAFDLPVTLNNVKVKDNSLTAGSMVVYSLDENDNLKSAKVYVNPVVEYKDSKYAKDEIPEFGIVADYIFELANSDGNLKVKKALFDASEHFAKDVNEVYRESEAAVIPVRKNVNMYLSDWDSISGFERYNNCNFYKISAKE